MPNPILLNSRFVLMAACLGLALFIATLSIEKLAAAPEQRKDDGKSRRSGATDTFQDFDMPGTGTPYTAYAEFPGAEPQRMTGGPTGSGELMRLAFVHPRPAHNSITFDRTHSGAPDLIVADFDFRLTLSNTGRADGMAFALLNTTEYGTEGAVVPHTLYPWVAEEPNFRDSLGIGFDIYQSDIVPPDINQNHISVHFDGQVQQMFAATPAMNLAEGVWTHARIVMRPGGGYSDVSVILTPCGAPAVTLVDQFPMPDFLPYEGRVYFATRSGGQSADQDIDNVLVQFLNQGQSVVAFNTGCAAVVETNGEVNLTVTRMGDTNSSTTVGYATAPVSAAAGSDYLSTEGMITFTSGEISKTISIPVLDDAINEGDEIFQVMLGEVYGQGAVGGPAVVRVTIVDNEAAQQGGHWDQVLPLPAVPIHAHLLPTGEMMFWDRHDNEWATDAAPRIWNSVSGLVTPVALPGYDIFCAGHSFMADGRLLVAGGHIIDGVGETRARIYDPFADSWEYLPDMNFGRWYPSNVTLANEDVLVVAGTGKNGQVNLIPQVWEESNQAWRDLTDAAQGYYPDYADFYPYMYQAPNGQVFVAGPQQMARYLDPSGTGAWTDVAASTLEYREYGSSVMYDEGQVLILGGNPRPMTDTEMITPSASVEVIDLNALSPAWRTVEPMNFPRRQHTATLLPDGTVFVTGGSSLPGFDNAAGAVLTPEIWNPVTEQWTPMAAHDRYRGYHSIALLFPDGRVLVGGGGHPDSAAGPQYNFEIYSPPYLFRGPRPTISFAPSIVSYDHTFLLEMADAANIQNVTWIRLGSVTHSFDQNQRINHLSFTQVTDGLHVTTPANPNLAPPGHYMLFILDENSVPSEASLIQLLPPDQIEPPVAGFTSSSPDFIGETTQFVNTSTGTGLVYTWDFGDGSSLNEEVNPAHDYGAPGTYMVTLTATNPAGSHTITGVVEIAPRPVYVPVILKPDD